MSLIYSIGLPDDPIIDVANNIASYAPLLSDFTALLLRLQTIDFASYDQRRAALRQLATLADPRPLTNTGSFDPLQYPILPPYQQQRFPGFGVYVPIRRLLYSIELSNISQALAYTDSQGSITESSVAYFAALDALTLLVLDPLTLLTRASFELEYLIVWSFWPIIPP